LLIGNGVIGSVYGSMLVKAGHTLSVLKYNAADPTGQAVLAVRQSDGQTHEAPCTYIADVHGIDCGMVLVAVQAGQIPSTLAAVRSVLADQPDLSVLYIGNNPNGLQTFPDDIRPHVVLGFPGIGGYRDADRVTVYTPVNGQPTGIQASDSLAAEAFAAAVQATGLPIDIRPDMDGWLKYHTVFITCMCRALLLKDGQPSGLAGDRAALRRMCRAITEGFSYFTTQHVGGVPKNLRVLHNRFLTLIALNYWRKVLRSSNGDLYFGKHARSAPEEIELLSAWLLARIPLTPQTQTLHQLLQTGLNHTNLPS